MIFELQGCAAAIPAEAKPVKGLDFCFKHKGDAKMTIMRWTEPAHSHPQRSSADTHVAFDGVFAISAVHEAS